MPLTPSQVHVDAALTNLSFAQFQMPTAFVASNVFPMVPVSNQSDRYHVWNDDDSRRIQAGKRAPGTKGKVMTRTLSQDTYFSEERLISEFVSDQTLANADQSVSIIPSTVTNLGQQLRMEKEQNFASKFMSTGIWDTDITGVAAAPGAGQTLQWNDANSAPIEDVRAAINTIAENSGFMPNVMVMGRRVYSALIDHPDIQGRISGGATTAMPSLANLNILAQIFEVDEILVSTAIQNTAAEGLTASNSFIIGKSCLLAYRAPNPGINIATAGMTFNWAGYLPGQSIDGYVVDSYRPEGTDGIMYRARCHYDHKATATNLGYFWNTIVA